MSVVYLDDTPLSSAIQLLLHLTRSNVKGIRVNEDVLQNSNEFRTASPKGELPALVHGGATHIGLLDVAKSIASDTPYKSVCGDTDSDKKEIEKWLKYCKTEVLPILQQSEKLLSKLHKINKDLLSSVFCIGEQLTVIDLLYFVVLNPTVKQWSDQERFTFCNLTRWFDFIQHFEGIENYLPVIRINVTSTAHIEAKKKRNLR